MKRRTVAIVCLCLALTLPAQAFAAPVKAMQSGRVPKKWDLAKPAVVSHPDTTPPSAGGDGDGANNIPFYGFDDGDLIVVLGTLTGHAGEWDDTRFNGSLYSYCVWSANTAPRNGVQLERPLKYRYYDVAYGLWVPYVTIARRVAARAYCSAQNGEPYNIQSSKTNQSAWYCSKLGWSSYRYTSGVDLDADGGYWVWPVDLLNDSQTSLFAYGD